MKLEEKINNLLSDIYCDDCKFNTETEEYWNDKLGYYGCNECHRKYIGWEPSPGLIQELIKVVKES